MLKIQDGRVVRPGRPARQEVATPTILTAFCTSCPDEKEVRDLLRPLGMYFTLALPAVEERVQTRAQPAQFHYEDSIGTMVSFLAGEDYHGFHLVEDESGYTYPRHQSRFWITPGGQPEMMDAIRMVLAPTFDLTWRNAKTGRVLEVAH